MRMNKNKVYIIIVLLLTVITTSWIIFFTPTENISTPSSIREDLSFVDDVTLDSFINIYAKDILQLDTYEMTLESREKIRTLLASMGDINIKKIKQILFKGNRHEMLEGVQNFIEENFLWEEKALMIRYIVEE
ncbi:MAG: hypothetical protein MJA31_07785 [Clostridia bacterium]|nr:hypothetical protein [Clostridia bacterium]